VKGCAVEIVIVSFTLDGMSEAGYRGLCDQVAPAFAEVPGLVSKVWLVDAVGGVYGGVYTFGGAGAVDAFLVSELFATVGATPGLAGITVRRFGVLVEPTAVTRGLVATAA
jgi:hypothetical protein